MGRWELVLFLPWLPCHFYLVGMTIKKMLINYFMIKKTHLLRGRFGEVGVEVEVGEHLLPVGEGPLLNALAEGGQVGAVL